MRLAEMSITNFRSVRAVSFSLDHMSRLLGPNNHGKSNLLAAVEFLLSPGMKLTSEDFFAERAPDDNRLTVEASFVELTEQEAKTFEKYVRDDGCVRIQKWASLTEGGTVEAGYRGYIQQPCLWWLQEASFDRLRTRDAIAEAATAVPQLAALLEEGGRITKERVRDFQDKYIHEHRDHLEFEEILEESPLLGVKNIAGGDPSRLLPNSRRS